MRRDPARLADTAFDLLVIGAGIHGACAAWDAALRGLSVAIVDQNDFGSGTSANSLRIVHGGFRYLTRGDLFRMRESIRERSTLLRIARGLVEPLPVLVPVYGIGARGRVALGTALALNDLTSWSRNRNLDPERLIPRGRLVSRDECLRLFPGFAADGLTGGALWFDAQLLHPERLTLSFVQAADTLGAIPANYVRIDSLRIRDGTVHGARATDRLTGTEFDIEARSVLVAAGPWTRDMIATVADHARPLHPSPERAMGLNLVIGRRLSEVAVGVRARTTRRADPVGGGRRFLFLAPQGNATLLGTWYTMAEDELASARAVGIRALLQEFNAACPGLRLSLDDVVRCQWGWLPLRAGNEPGRADALAERARIIDHGRKQGPARLISVEGVKYTTARRVAEQAIDKVFKSLGRVSPLCRTADLRLPGAQASVSLQPALAADTATVLCAVRDEMAVKLDDIVFRRTTLGTAPGPDRAVVEQVARVAGAELGWNSLRQEAEIDAVMRQAGLTDAALEAVG